MVDVVGVAKGLVPSFAGVGKTITIFLYVIIFAAIAGVIAYFIITRLKFNKRIIIYENLTGKGYVPVDEDRAMVVKISSAGEELLKLKKRKIYKGAYGQKIGKNIYAFAIGKDGYWYNIVFGNLDEALSELKIIPVDRDMRYMHEGIRKNVTANFDKKNWFKENIGLLVGFGVIIITLVFMWLLADKYFTIFGQVDKSVTTWNQIGDKLGGIVTKLDAICTGGTGIKPA